MNDFSAAALTRLIPLGLKRLGLEPGTWSDKIRGPHLPIATKAAILDRIASVHGRAALLRIGEGLIDAPDEPVLTALTLAEGPRDLIGRWQRLERYVHSHHRLSCRNAGTPGSGTELVLTHQSTRPADVPHPHESLLVFGMLVVLLEMTGALKLQARLASDADWRYGGGAWRDIALPADSVNCLHICWQPAVLATSSAGDDGNGLSAGKPALSAALLAQRVADVIRADPARQWRLAQVAAQLAVSERSLQRHLQRQGSSFSALLARTRATCAAEQLINTMQPAAQVGYICGYADQAHFNRSFRQFTAQTPLQYRRSFQAGLPVT